jgi:hypothetical protein
MKLYAVKNETAVTIRAYFLFFGIMDILVHHDLTREGRGIPWLSLIGLLLGIAYVLVGVAFRALLNRSVWLINSLLVAGLSYGCVVVVSRAFMDEFRYSPAEVAVRIVTGIFLTSYVMNNVSRLAAGMQNGSRVPQAQEVGLGGGEGSV